MGEVGEPGVGGWGSKVGRVAGRQLGQGVGFVYWGLVVDSGGVFGWNQRRGMSHCRLRTRHGGGGLPLGGPGRG